MPLAFPSWMTTVVLKFFDGDLYPPWGSQRYLKGGLRKAKRGVLWGFRSRRTRIVLVNSSPW